MTQIRRNKLCDHGEMVAVTDNILLAVIDGRPIRTDDIDRLAPWRAKMVIQVALRAGGQLQHGDPETFNTAAKTAGGAAEPGWWRAALGMEPVDHDYVPPVPGPAVAPPGWRIVHDPNA